MTGEPIRIVLRLFITVFYLEYACGGSGVVMLCTYDRKCLLQCLFSEFGFLCRKLYKYLNDLFLKYDAL